MEIKDGKIIRPFLGLSNDLLKAKNKSEIFEVLLQLGDSIQGREDFKLSHCSIAALVNSAILQIQEKGFGNLNKKEKMFILSNFSLYITFERFEMMCNSLINANTEPEFLGKILYLVETHPELAESEQNEMMLKLNDIFGDDDYRGEKLITIIKQSTNPFLQMTLWFKVDFENMTKQGWAELLREDWKNVPNQIILDIYNYNEVTNNSFSKNFNSEMTENLLALIDKIKNPERKIALILNKIKDNWFEVKEAQRKLLREAKNDLNL